MRILLRASRCDRMASAFRRPRVVLIVVAFCLSVVACDEAGSPVAERSRSSHPAESAPRTQPIRQTDDAGRRLPFTTRFPNRWSANNDGTRYEPCTAVTNSELLSFELDPNSVRDVAAADHQTARGCRWSYQADRLTSLAQYLGNLEGSGATDLASYKHVNSNWHWLADESIDGRTAAIETIGRDECSTYLVSGRAVVVTAVALRNSESGVVCERALAFTRATIARIPR